MIQLSTLTDAQSTIFFFVRDFNIKFGRVPTVQQIMSKFWLSRHAVECSLKALDDKGAVLRDVYSGEKLQFYRPIAYRGSIA